MAHSNFIDSVANTLSDSFIIETELKVEDESQQANEDEHVAVEALGQLSCTLEVPNEETIPMVQIKAEEENIEFVHDVAVSLESCDGPDLSVKYQNDFINDTTYPYACNICSLKFEDQISMDGHASSHITDIKPYRCVICGLTFQRKSSLKNHSKIHTYGNSMNNLPNIRPEEPNIKVSKVKRSKKVVQKKQKIPPFETLKPNTVNTAPQFPIDNQSMFQEWVQIPEIKQEVCETVLNMSPEIHKTPEELDSEKLNGNLKPPVTSLETDIRAKPYECPFCQRTFAREKALLNHIRIHNDNYDLTLECHKCHETFDDIIYLQAHLLACVIPESIDQHQSSQSNHQPQQHIHTTQSIIESNHLEAIQNYQSNEVYEMKKITDNSAMGDYECHVCGKRFKTRQKVFRHMWVHRKKSHNCEVCGLSFPAVKFLDDHRLALHPSNTPFSCSQCGKSFMSKQGMVEHMRQHQGYNEQYYCAFCEKFFSSRQGFTIHGRIHTGERPYGCKYCHKSFRDGGTLKKHERIHTGERPHECPLCHKRYNQKVVLREHIRGVHVMKRNSEINGMCPICDMKDLDKEEMSEHIVKHSDQLMRQMKMDSLKKEKQFEKLSSNNIGHYKKRRLKNHSGEARVVDEDDDYEEEENDNEEEAIPIKETVRAKKRRVTKRNQDANFNKIKIPLKRSPKNKNSVREESVRANESNGNIDLESPDQICEPSPLTDESGSDNSCSRFESEIQDKCLNESSQDSKSAALLECEMCRSQFPTRSELITHVLVHI